MSLTARQVLKEIDELLHIEKDKLSLVLDKTETEEKPKQFL